MPPLEALDRTDDAVLWPFTGRTRRGEITVGAAVPLKVRWVNRQQIIVNPNGLEVGLDVTVVVDRDVPIDSLMWRGKLDDLPGTSPVPSSGIMQVKNRSDAKDLKGRFTERTLGLTRYSDTFPG